jgi:hypothetical protein
MASGGTQVGLGVRPMERPFGLPDLILELLVDLWRCNGGQGGPSFHGGEQLRRRTELTSVALRSNSRCCRAWIGDSGLGEAPGVKAKPRRGFAGAERRWRSMATVAQSVGDARLWCRQAELGLWVRR